MFILSKGQQTSHSRTRQYIFLVLQAISSLHNLPDSAVVEQKQPKTEVNEWAWRCVNTTSFTRTHIGLDSACRLSFTNPDFQEEALITMIEKIDLSKK